MSSVFFHQKFCSIFKVNFSAWILHPTFQKAQEWVSFTTHLMFAVNSYSQRCQSLREGGKITGPRERGCQIRKRCVTGHEDNHFTWYRVISSHKIWCWLIVANALFMNPQRNCGTKVLYISMAVLSKNVLLPLRPYFQAWLESAQLSRHLGEHRTVAWQKLYARD